MNVEDRVRIATRARTDLVRDIRPLELPAERPLRSRFASGPRRWTSWAAPVAAAAVVVALAITLVSIRQMNEPPVSPTRPAQTLPEYYAAIIGPGLRSVTSPAALTTPDSVVVGDDRTGQVLATFRPPAHQTFAAVSAAANDRTFVVESRVFRYIVGDAVVSSGPPAAWYLLRLAPGEHQFATLTRLPVPGLPSGTVVDGISLSPDGSELAVMGQDGVDAYNRPLPVTLRIYPVWAGRAVRTWTAPPNPNAAGFGVYPGRDSNSSVSWLADGHTLAFGYVVMHAPKSTPGGAAPDVTLRTLDLARPGHDLLADSRVVLSLRGRRDPACDTLQLTADGTTAICGTQLLTPGGKDAPARPRILEYTIATGKSRVIFEPKGFAYTSGVADVLWASSSGATLVGSVAAQRSSSRLAIVYRAAWLIIKGRLTPLTFPAGQPFAGEVAF